jgi:uncharacterized membrane protein YqiK
MGGRKVIVDGGILYVPVVHKLIEVPLETMRLDVVREGKDALITQDYLRADLKAEFFIKVQSNDDDIINAARSLGERSVDPNLVKQLVFDKLVSALRTVAANKTLFELNTKRDDFAREVMKIVETDLKHNGLTLESVTISKLDQTDTANLSENNVFDAQGLKRITEITQRAAVEKNREQREAEQNKKAKDVETRKQVLSLEKEQAEAEANQKRDVDNIIAERNREAAAFKIAQDEMVAKREVQKVREIENEKIDARKKLIDAEKTRDLTNIEKEQAVETSIKAKEAAIIEAEKLKEVADVNRQGAVEVANRQQQIAIADAETQRALAESKRLAAEADREKNKQTIKTVEVTMTAERDKEKSIIGAKAIIEQERLEEQMKAEVEAYRQIAIAEGQRKAADQEYEAKVRKAEGDFAASQKQADADKAIKMVDVIVEREKVNVEASRVEVAKSTRMIDVEVERQRVQVEQARVEVNRQDLENKQTYSEAALSFELRVKQIEADRDVRTSAARAIGEMLSKGNIKLFGTPDMMNQVLEPFMKGFGLSQVMDGLDEGTDGDFRKLLQGGASALSALIEKVTGKKPAPGQVEQALKDMEAK